MQIRLSVGRIKLALFVVWALLTGLGFCAEAWKYVLYFEKNEFVYTFGLSYEQNVPTWYSSALLFTCAMLLGGIALSVTQQGGRFRWHWWVLAAAFVYISLDEAITLHENASDWFDLSGVLYFGWVIPATAIVVLFGLCYVPFLIHLPPRTRWRFMLAGAVYVGGALVMEFPLGYWTDHFGRKNLGYGLIDLVEESMEILGVTIFLLALLDYLGRPDGRVEIRLEEPAR